MVLGGGAKAKIKLFRNVVMLHIKLKPRMQQHVANILPTDTPSTPGVGSKGQTIFSESSHVSVNLAVKGELGRFPIGISCMLQAFKYWYNIQSSSNILLQEALAVSQNLHEERIFTWFSFFSSLCKLVNVR